MGPWHHVGKIMGITLKKNWIISVIRWELNPCNKYPEMIYEPMESFMKKYQIAANVQTQIEIEIVGMGFSA